MKVLPRGGIVVIGAADYIDKISASELETKLGPKRELIQWHKRTKGADGDGWEMSIGVQGNIHQEILKTKHQDLWRRDRSRFINLQIVNAAVFQRITGLAGLQFPNFFEDFSHVSYKKL
ncbi:uncharacterized protein DFL_005594 [Arthrobotrys flagrans]|uniref:Uncharacterized protein n=1 Tax=Arthrobotrys flagrans TaxID=97331 RepID=A0A436ZXY2_ARTFL|nr:hypothetical protein DFL_005594 [Arthrobotrys flagrans]